MCLLASDALQRKEVTEELFNYRSLTQENLWDDYSAYEHCAKIEVPISTASFKIFFRYYFCSCLDSFTHE